MKKLFSTIITIGLLFSVNAYAEKTYLICKEINKNKIDSYSFDGEFVYSGAAKYKITSNTDTVYATFENDTDNEWGFIRIDMITGIMERAHGLVLPGEKNKSAEMFKKNMLFEIFYNCEKTKKKIIKEKTILNDQSSELVVDLLKNTKSILPECEGLNHTKWTNCFTAAQFTDGYIYKGEWKDGLYHGKGKLTLPDGSVETGGWKYGKLEWQKDFDNSKVLNGIWKIKQPVKQFLKESDHNFVEEEIYIHGHWVGFVKADHICQLLATEKEFIPNKNLKKLGIEGNAFVILATNCKNNEGKFGFDNIFIANKGSLVFFQYSTNFEQFFPTFPFKIGGPSPYINSFQRNEVKFIKINKISDKMNKEKFLGKFKHKFSDLN